MHLVLRTATGSALGVILVLGGVNPVLAVQARGGYPAGELTVVDHELGSELSPEAVVDAPGVVAPELGESGELDSGAELAPQPDDEVVPDGTTPDGTPPDGAVPETPEEPERAIEATDLEPTPAPAPAEPAPDVPTDAEIDASQIPERIAVEGTLIVIAEEAPTPSSPAFTEWSGSPSSADAVPLDTALSAPQVLLATDAGSVLPLAPGQVAGAETGQRFSGEAELGPELRVDVAEALSAADGDTPTPVEAPAPAAIPATAPLVAEGILEAALGEARAGGERLPVAGLIIPGTGVGTELQPQAHAADVLFYAGGGNPTDGQLSQLVRDAGNYWVGQTRGVVSSLSVGAVKRSEKFAKNRGMRCDSRHLDALWDDAARQFGRTANSYIGSGRHLVVFVDDACGALAQNSAGWGSYGVMHSGGMIWVDLGARRAGGLPITGVTGMVTHELGHNLGLGHGKSRVCSGTATDSPTQGGLVQAPCADVEYGDPFNVMGIGAWRGDRKPPALSIAQQDALGVAGSGAVRTVRPGGGASQTFTLAPTGNSGGLRGLNIAGSTGGEFYVEFRAMSGQDSGMGLKAGSVYESGQTRGEYFTASGVRLVKGDPVRNLNGTHRYGSTVVSVRDSQLGVSGLFQTARKGKQLIPWNGTARVVVLDVGATSAKVRVDFMPFVDVPYSHKFADEIAWMGTSALSTGSAVGGGLREYRPSDRVTREAMAAFLYRMEAPKNFRAPVVSPFADVPVGHKFYREISWMYATGLSTGTRQASGKPKYHPKTHVSREAMAAFLYRLEQPRVSAPKVSPFRDVQPGQKFYREIAWMSQAKLSTGTAQPSGKPKYLPKTGVSREAMAAFLQRLQR